MKEKNIFSKAVRCGRELVVSRELDLERFKKLEDLRLYRHEEARLKAYIAGDRPVKVKSFMQELAGYLSDARRYGWKQDPEIKMFCRIMQDVLEEAPKQKSKGKGKPNSIDAGEGARRFVEGATGRKVVQAPSSVDLEHNRRLVQNTATEIQARDDDRWKDMLAE